MTDDIFTFPCPVCGEEVGVYSTRLWRDNDNGPYTGPVFFKGHGDNFGCMGGHTSAESALTDRYPSGKF